MKVNRMWCSVIGVAALSVATLAAAAPASAGGATHHRFPVINYHPTPKLGNRPTARLAGGLPTFTSTQSDHGSTFRFTMVGKYPRVTQSAPVTTVKAELIPVKFVISGGPSNDPTTGNSCDSTAATTRTTNSPIVKSFSWTFGGTPIGTGQYTDAFQRAEFWKFTGPSGINPGYHVNLSWTKLAKITITVPASSAVVLATSPCRLIGIDVNGLDPFLQNTVLPQLRSQGLVSASTFPMFLTRDVVEYDSVPTNCCILGFHNAFNVSNGIQTYGISDYDTTGLFTPPPATNPIDVEILSHEVAEWMNDPIGTNPTKPWGNIGQVTGCQNNLEVGDPLSGTDITRTVGGFVYHLQELAFFSWFYHQSPSIGVNGRYSSNGTFTTSAAPCP